MKKILSLLILIFFFCVGLGIVFSIRVWQEHNKVDDGYPTGGFFVFASPRPSPSSLPLSPAPTMTLGPPRESLTGTITSLTGDVSIFKRTALDYAPATVEQEYVIPESVRTGEDSDVVIEFPDFARITLEENSQITSVSLLPSNFTIEHITGDVLYECYMSSQPVSVRYGGAVIKINGKTQISIDEEEHTASVSVETEKATVAMLNSSLDTMVYTVESGEEAVIDTQEETITVEEKIGM